MATIKHNEDDGVTELWIDGQFSASWRLIDIPDDSKRIIEAMIDHGIQCGEYLKMVEIRKVIGA